jgi:class 3 adenylate cyclase/tetratricopeptide (TPR) repeat protein
MLCGRCSTENPDGNRFCNACGAALEKTCAACHHANRPESRFCGNCGAALPDGAVPVPLKTAAVAGYVPEHLAARILDSRRSLEGERKQVTVLFADIRGSMELIQKLDPEQALQRLEPGLKAMIDAVHRYEGTVSRVQGDGIMALFGAPLAHEDHAVRACFAARAMLDTLAQLGRDSVQIRVGLNSGEVVVRSIGNDLSMDYDAIGATVHLANRMEQLAAPGTARLTVNTARLAKGFTETRSLGTIEVKGVSAPIEIFELIATAGRSRWDVRATAQGLTLFVGRETEMLTLSSALRRAAHGRGQLVAIVGEAGMGKSRLVHEFLGAQSGDAWAVMRTSGVPHDRSTPHLIIADLLRSWLGVGDQDGVGEIGGKLRLRLAALDRTLSTSLAPLQSLLDLPIDDPDWERLDPHHRRLRIQDAIKRLLAGIAATKPLILVIEDLHLIDSESQVVLDAIVESLGPAHLLLVVTYRPEYQHGWISRSYYSQIRVDPLEVEAADAFLRHHLGGSDQLAPLRRRLIERTEGTPFFLEEIVRALVDTGVLVREPVYYRLTRTVDQVEIPGSVQAVLAARIDRLPAEHRALLQLASVIGKDVPLTLLEAIAETSEENLHRQLSELQNYEFVYEINLPSGTEYTFKHALTHAVTYEGMLLKHRRVLHARVAQAIEEHYADRLDEFTERLADHALKGELWPRAVEYYEKAGQRGNARSAHREAIAFFEQALEALAHLPSDRSRIDRAIEIRLGLRVALAALGELRAIHERLEEAAELALSVEDRPRLALINISKSTILSNLGALDEAVAAGLHGRAIAEEMGDAASTVNAGFALGQAYWNRGEFQKAADILEKDLGSIRGDLRGKHSGTTGTSSVLCLVSLSHTYCFMGQLDKAVLRSEEAVSIARETGRPYDLSYANAARGLAHLTIGDLDGAIVDLEEALRLCRAAEIRLLFPHTARYLGRAYALTGRLNEAHLLLEEAVAQSGALALVGLQAWCSSALGLTHLTNGALAKADAIATTSLELSRKHGYRPAEVHALRLIGSIHAKNIPSEAAQAERRYREALELATTLGMKPEVAHANRDLAELFSRTGRSSDARRASSVAAELYKSMGMARYIVEPDI